MKKSNRRPGGEWESGATYSWWCFTGTSTLPIMAHPQVLLHIVLCGNSPTYEYWIHSLKMKWYDTSVKAECLSGGASTTPTPIMTSDPVTHCLSLQLKSYSLLSDLLNKVTHCLSTSHTSGILCWPVTQSSTLPLYLPKQPYSLIVLWTATHCAINKGSHPARKVQFLAPQVL